MWPFSRPSDEVEEAFRVYRRTASPDALARVFDALAPDLLRVAAYLTRRRQDAEDVVHDTFLAAMHTRQSYDESGQIRPWLIGILRNRVFALRGKQRRRELHDERRFAEIARYEPALDPRDAVSERELRENIDGLSEELGPVYAEVLRLHLDEGLQAKEIAKRLDRPPGTVRTQIVRAMEALRRRLPDHVLAGCVPRLGVEGATETALVTMRQKVLAAAGEPAVLAGATVAAGTFLWGVLLMHKKAIAASALMLVFLTAAVAWPLGGDAQPSEATASASTQFALQAAEAEVSAARVDRAEAEPTTGPVHGGGATVRARVVWHHDRSPAAGVGVTLGNGFDPLRRDAVTSALGEVEWTDVTSGMWNVRAALAGAAVERLLSAGEVVEVELVAERRAVILGQVVDDAGEPVFGAAIWVSAADHEHGHEVTQSDAAGRFEVPIHSKHAIGALKRGYGRSRVVEVDANTAPTSDVTLRLSTCWGSVAGIVRDAAGHPIAGAWVMVGEARRNGLGSVSMPSHQALPRGGEATTDDLGAFRVDGIQIGTCFVRAWASHHAGVLTEIEVLRGTEASVDLTLPAGGGTVQGQVTDERGRPIAGAKVSSDLGVFERTQETDALGNYTIRDLPIGELTVSVTHRCIRDRVTVRTAPGASIRWSPSLGASLDLAGRVVDAKDAPMSGVTVEAYVDYGDGTGQCKHVQTGATGDFALQEIGSNPVELIVKNDFHDILRLQGVLPGRKDLLLRIADGDLPRSFLRGVLLDEGGRPVTGRVYAMSASANWMNFAEVDHATGAFLVGPVRSGEYIVDIESSEVGLRHLGAYVLHGNAMDLGTITLPAMGTASFIVSIDGHPLPSGWLSVWPAEGIEDFSDSHYVEDGRTGRVRVPAGRNWVSCGHDRRDQPYHFHMISVDVPAGAELPPIQIELKRTGLASITVATHAADLLDSRLHVRSLTSDFRGEYRLRWTDGLATAELNLPLDRFVVEIRNGNRCVSGDIDNRLGTGSLILSLPR